MRIAAYAAGPEADAALADAWGGAPGLLLRALRSDVALRHVALGDTLPPLPFPAQQGTYALAHADGDVDGTGGAVLVEPFEADAPGLDAAWEALRALLAPRQGYLGARLYRSEGPAAFPVFALVRWSSPLMYARALGQEEVTAARAALPATGRPALYLRVEP